MELPFYEQVIRLLLALLLGSLVGFERERSSHAAGFRTHALVCVGSALIILVSTYGFDSVEGAEGVSIDPSRVAAQVVSGIGFVGAGAIIVQRSNIRGLTTAASLWTVAAIGLAAGAGMYVASVAGTLVALIVLVPLKYVEEHFIRPGGATADVGREPVAPGNVLTQPGPRRYRLRQRGAAGNRSFSHRLH
jgi:putative Mg2+ transporter-C (MgtC) family protein